METGHGGADGVKARLSLRGHFQHREGKSERSLSVTSHHGLPVQSERDREKEKGWRVGKEKKKRGRMGVRDTEA